MAKNNNKNKPQAQPPAANKNKQVITPKAVPAVKSKPKAASFIPPPVDPFANEPKGFSLYNFHTQAIIIALLGFIFYFNSIFNENAHDDGISIVKNEYVQEGFAGIPKILTTDAYDSYYRQLNSTNQLSGGRYRPLSFITFAIEQQFFGAHSQKELDLSKGKNVDGTIGIDMGKLMMQMHVRHAISVVFFVLSVIALLYFLRLVVFPTEPIIAFLAALLFTIHPIHTEVIANVKSRDEILSLLFICLTFIYAYRYKIDDNRSTLIKGLVCFFLSLLAKEYALTLIVLIPLMFYLFRKYPVGKSIATVLPYIAVFIVYVAIRYNAVGPKSDNSDNEVLNNPYLFATPIEKVATEIATLLNYLKLLVFPHPLSSDYSYAQLGIPMLDSATHPLSQDPYLDFGNLLVWLSVVVHVGIVVAFFKLIKERNVLCFAIAIYLTNLFLVCNIFLDIGATMGERLIYHSSIGFAIAEAYLLYKGFSRIKPATLGMRALAGLVLVITVLSGFKTVERNKVWKNDITLFTTDVNTVPNSVLANGNAAVCYTNLSDAVPATDTAQKNMYLRKALIYFNKAIDIHPHFVAGYVNRGLVYFKLGNMERAKGNWDTARIYYPTYPTLPNLYASIGQYYANYGWNEYVVKGKYTEAIAVFNKGLQLVPGYPDLLSNLAGTYFFMKDYPDAGALWNKVLQERPADSNATKGLMMIKQAMAAPAAK